MAEEYQAIAPQDPILRRCIDKYYFHRSTDPDFERRFIYYPSHRSALNIYKNVTVDLHDQGRVYRPHEGDALDVVFTNGCSQIKQVQLNGCFEKIGILFHSLGFNHFIDFPLHDLLQSAHAIKTDVLGKELIPVAQAVFQTPDLEAKRDLLDTFLSGKWVPFQDQRFQALLDEIQRTRGAIRLGSLADVFGVHRKTIARGFRQHLDFSFREYIGTLRFRNALDDFHEKQSMKMVEIAYNNAYYDQAGFNKHFKALAQLTPRALFAQLQKREGKVYWNYQDS